MGKNRSGDLGLFYLDSELRGPNIHTALVFTLICNLSPSQPPFKNPGGVPEASVDLAQLSWQVRKHTYKYQ